MMLHPSPTPKTSIDGIAPNGLTCPSRDATSSDHKGKRTSESTCPVAGSYAVVNGSIINTMTMTRNGTMGQHPLSPESPLRTPPWLRLPPTSVVCNIAPRALPLCTMGYSISPQKDHPQGVSYLHQACMPMFGQSVSSMGQFNASPVESLLKLANLKNHSPQRLHSGPTGVHVFPPLENVRLIQPQLPSHILSRDSLVQPHHPLPRPQALRNIQETPPLSPSISPAPSVPAPPNKVIELDTTVSLELKKKACHGPSPQPSDQEAQVTQNVTTLLESDSWMYNIDKMHPSPAILLADNESSSLRRAVKSDIKTKQFPIVDDDVTRYDILSGRGGKTNHHEGNIELRRLVSKYKKPYICAQKFEKRRLVGLVVNFVRRGRRGGRFLQRNKDDGMWYEIGDDRASTKMAQLLREGASVSSLYRELGSGDHSKQVEQMMRGANNKLYTGVASSGIATTLASSSSPIRSHSNSSSVVLSTSPPQA